MKLKDLMINDNSDLDIEEEKRNISLHSQYSLDNIHNLSYYSQQESKKQTLKAYVEYCLYGGEKNET